MFCQFLHFSLPTFDEPVSFFHCLFSQWDCVTIIKKNNNTKIFIITLQCKYIFKNWNFSLFPHCYSYTNIGVEILFLKFKRESCSSNMESLFSLYENEIFLTVQRKSVTDKCPILGLSFCPSICCHLDSLPNM